MFKEGSRSGFGINLSIDYHPWEPHFSYLQDSMISWTLVYFLLPWSPPLVSEALESKASLVILYLPHWLSIQKPFFELK